MKGDIIMVYFEDSISVFNFSRKLELKLFNNNIYFVRDLILFNKSELIRKLNLSNLLSEDLIKGVHSKGLMFIDELSVSVQLKLRELIEQEQLRTLNAESIANLQQEIANIELKIAEKEKEQAKEVNLYRIEAITLSELESRVSVIKKDIGSFRSAIKNKQAEIDNINDFLTNRLNESVTDMVLAAEGNPAEMKKYVNRFIKKIVVHLSDRYHSILEVIPKKYMGAIKAQSFVVPVIDEDEDGNIIESGYEVLQTEDMKFEINDSDYIVIDKKRMLAFAIDNTILAHSVTYDREQRGFVYTNDYNGGVPLSTETLVGLYLISQSSNKEAVKALRESFGITFKSLTY